MRNALALLVVLALTAAGCGAQQDSSTDRFQGAEAQVAQVIEDLQSAGEKGDAQQICDEILARALVDQIKAAGADCASEMEDAIADADDYELEVRDVTVSGNTATAEVRQADGGNVRTFEFAREGNGWRATALGGN
jgi:hypothetical protein